MVNSQVRLLIDRGDLELVRGHLVMTSLTRNSQLQRLDLQVLHERLYTIRNRTEIVVVHLLVLGRVMSHQCSTCQHQVRTGGIQTFIHQEILLFPSEVTDHLLDGRIEIVNHTQCSITHGTKCTFQRCFVVERLPGIGNKDRRNTQRIIDDEHR